MQRPLGGIDTMQRTHDTMMTPPIEDLLATVDSKFSLVTLGARRARQLNSYYSQLGDGLGQMVPPQVVTGPGHKPLSMSFEEIAAGKIVRVEWTEEVEADADEAVADEA